jgi:hypothetical protein
MIQSDLSTGVVLISYGMVMWLIILWEKYFPQDDKRFPRKGNEQLHKWFEEERRKTFKP